MRITGVANTFKHSVDSIPNFAGLAVKQRDVGEAHATFDANEAAAKGKKKRRKDKKPGRQNRGRVVEGVEQFEDEEDLTQRDVDEGGDVNVGAVADKGKEMQRKERKKGKQFVAGVEIVEKRDANEDGDVNIAATASEAAGGKKKGRKGKKKEKKPGVAL